MVKVTTKYYSKQKNVTFWTCFFPAQQLIITWVRGPKKEVRHLHYMIDTVAGYWAGQIEPYEVSCLSVILTRHQPEAIRKRVHVSIERNTILCVRCFFYIKISQIRRGNEKVSFFLPSSLHYSPSTSENLLMRSNFLFHVKWMLSTRWHNSSEMVVPIFVHYQ